jgi:hypothetical protein
VARPHCCHQKDRREQPRHELHFKPQSNRTRIWTVQSDARRW